MELHFKIAGIIQIMLALIHFIFPRYFNWKTEMVGLSLINRQMMYVHTFFIAVAVFFMGILCLTSANELLYTALGKKIIFGIGLFWLLRLFIQVFGYSSTLWKGKRFETSVHIVFLFVWIYFSSVFLYGGAS